MTGVRNPGCLYTGEVGMCVCICSVWCHLVLVCVDVFWGVGEMSGCEGIWGSELMWADVWVYMCDQRLIWRWSVRIWGQASGFRFVGGSWCRDMCGTVRFSFFHQASKWILKFFPLELTIKSPFLEVSAPGMGGQAPRERSPIQRVESHTMGSS